MAQNLSNYRKILSEFLLIYRNEPCLWQMKNKSYHSRHKKDVALEKLLIKYKEIDPNADCDSVLKKINSLRTTYNKERKKIEISKTVSGGDDAVYEPKLWYFKKLSFLDNKDEPKTSHSNIDDDEEAKCDFQNMEQDNSILSVDNYSQSNEQFDNNIHTPSDMTPRPKALPKLKRKSEVLAKSVLETINDHFKRPRDEIGTEDRHDIFGKSIAFKLRDLPKQQRILTEKLINDVLFEAEWGNLTLDYKLINTCPDNREGSFS